jgi:predicted RND superfamily exporter protein
MMETLARFILARRYYILLVILLTTLLLGSYSLRIDLNKRPDELMFKDDPEYPRLQAFFEEFGYDEMVAAAYRADNVLEADQLETIRRITQKVSELEGVSRVVSIGNAQDVFVEEGTLLVAPLVRSLPKSAEERDALRKRIEQNPLYDRLLVSAKNNIALFDITLDARMKLQERDITLQHIDEIFVQQGGNPHYLAGSPIGRSEIFRCMRRDFSTLFPMGMLLLILAMYFLFRNYLCILLPFVAISLSVVWTVGLMYLVGTELNFFSVLIPTILFIIGTSDCVHILSQYQDCRHTCKSKSEALKETIHRMVLPCFLTTLTTMIGFLSLLACRIEALKLFGIFSAIGMGFAFLLSITLLPIGLSIGDTRPMSLRRPPSEAFLGLLNGIERTNLSKGRTILILFLAVSILAVFGLVKLRVETDPAKFFGDKMRVVTDMVFIERELGGFIPFFVVVQGQEEGRIKDPSLLKKIDRLGEFIRQAEGVDKVVSASDLIKYMNFRLHDDDPSAYRIPETRDSVAQLLLMASLSDESGMLSRFFDHNYSKTSLAIRFRHHDFDSYQRLMNQILPYLASEFTTVPGVTTYVTGTNMMLANTLMPFLQGLKEGLFLAGAAILVLMMLLFRSIRVGFISMVPNLIPFMMTLGAMGLFGISLNFGIAPIAAIALGIAIDDTIHFLSRFRIEFKEDRNYEGAIRRTMKSVGKPILITSIILTAGFFIFLLSDFQYTRNMGMLISFTVIGAIFGDLLLLPVLLLVLKPLGRKAHASGRRS